MTKRKATKKNEIGQSIRSQHQAIDQDLWPGFKTGDSKEF
jgi:hypothetical protein